MNIQQLLKQKITEAIEDLFSAEIAEGLDFNIEHPDNEKWGDYASNAAMKLAPSVKQSPQEIAKKLRYKLGEMTITFSENGREHPLFEKIDFAPSGFINFKLSPQWLNFVLNDISLYENSYRVGKNRQGKSVLIEYSNPNPNKPLHIGHARNNFLGSTLVNIFEFLGYEVIEANYINDWGTHICKSMLMHKKYFSDIKEIGDIPSSMKPDHFVGELYARFERESAENPALNEEVAEMFRKLEADDPETKSLWEKITGWAYEGWKKTYADENISFDVWFYQHNYRLSGRDIVNKALEIGIAEKDETGAVIARLEKYGIPDKVLLRSDGTSLYSTQDLQLAKDTFEKYDLDKRLYVVDYRQSDYFKQIFKILEILGYEWAKNLYHVPYGVVKLPEGNMSSRKGLVVSADEVYETLKEKEREEIAASLKAVSQPDTIVDKVAMAAFRYGMLKTDSSQDIVFDFAQATKFEGNTGPYLLYTYARVNSVLAKADASTAELSETGEDYQYSEKEEAILRFMYRFPEVVEDSAKRYAPHLICNYLFELAQRFNTFYAFLPILNAESSEARDFRLKLAQGVSQVLAEGLGLLGIEVVESM